MKLSGYCCDRCGVRYEKNIAADPETRTNARIIGAALYATNKNLYRYDLCDECLEELFDWLYDARMHVERAELAVEPDDEAKE